MYAVYMYIMQIAEAEGNCGNNTSESPAELI